MMRGGEDGDKSARPRTPISSPRQLESPLECSLRKEVAVRLPGNENPMLTLPTLPRTPISSPVGTLKTIIIPHIISTPHEMNISKDDTGLMQTPIRHPKKVKPLSLRSRLKLAARRSVVVV
jgi:hypothetical protein